MGYFNTNRDKFPRRGSGRRFKFTEEISRTRRISPEQVGARHVHHLADSRSQEKLTQGMTIPTRLTPFLTHQIFLVHRNNFFPFKTRRINNTCFGFLFFLFIISILHFLEPSNQFLGSKGDTFSQRFLDFVVKISSVDIRQFDRRTRQNIMKLIPMRILEERYAWEEN